MTPTYPKWEVSYIEGVQKAAMKIVNKRADVEWYEISVFDEEWEPIPFVLHSLGTKSYKLLKGSQHETFPKTIEAERDRGSVVKKGDDGRYYSVPKDKKYSYGGRVAKSSAEKS